MVSERWDPAGWDRYPVLGPQETHGPDYWLLDETRDHVIFAWLAGPAVVVRRSALGTHRTRVEYWNAETAAWTRYDQRRTTSDQEAIDDDINDGLRNVGIPPRPGGYDWLALRSMLRSEPEQLADELEEASVEECVDPQALYQRVEAVCYRYVTPQPNG